MSTFNYNHNKIWYEESGRGAPLVFLHNGGNDHRIWDRQITHFSKTHRVIAVDHIGHGNSDRPSVDYTLPLFTGEVAALIDQLHLAPVTLIGHCIGAAMALNYTLAHPADVRRLVLFNVATEKTLLAGPLADIYRNFSADPAALEAFVTAMESTGLPREQTEGGLQLQLGASRAADDPEFADYIHRLYNQKGQMRTLYNNLAQFATFRVLDEFTKPRTFPPVLLIWGESNQVLPRQAGEEVRQRLQPDRCAFLEDCGHLAMRERPLEINKMIEEFLIEPAMAQAR
jgi:pimeloyl-ACP methyl ester carboxylesterase